MTVEVSTTVVGRLLPFHCTIELAKKFEPDTPKVKAGPPAAAPLGERALIVGTGFVPLVMVKFTALEVAPPGAGLKTETAAVPAEGTAAAGMAAVNCVALTNVVAGTVPPKLTIEAATKFVPLIVSVKGIPATALVGEIVVIVGVGLVLIVLVAPPPHPARNTRLPIPEITRILSSTAWLFMTASSIHVMVLSFY
jgi:hypothetical protein